MTERTEKDTKKYGGYHFTTEGKLNVERFYTITGALIGEYTGIPGAVRNIRLKENLSDTRLFKLVLEGSRV